MQEALRCIAVRGWRPCIRTQDGPGMKKLLATLLTAMIVSLTVFPSGAALAAEITFVSVQGFWRDPVDSVPGDQQGDPVITNGDPISSISWGVPAGGFPGDQSGYDFIANVPPPFELPGPVPFFSLGDFQHRNFVVSEP